MHFAQIRIGKVMATRAIPVQVFEPPRRGESLPAGFADVDIRRDAAGMANGILGISPRRHVAKGYYVDRRGSGSQSKPDWREVSVDTPRQLANPISRARLTSACASRFTSARAPAT